MKTRKLGQMMLAVVCSLVLPTCADAVSFNLSTVVDQDTPIPDGTGNFFCLVGYSLSGTKVAFWGSGFQPPFFCEPSGIYVFDGTALAKVADTNTPIPGGSGNFTQFFSPPLISGNNVVFFANGSGSQAGIYLFDGSAIKKVVDLNTVIPGRTGTFMGFGSPALSGSNVVFFGFGIGGGGFYLFNGTTLTKVADGTTSIPPGGVGTFDGFGSVAISGNNVVFDGSGASFGQEGIYLFDGTSLSKIADTNTPIPGGTGNFVGFIFEGAVISGRYVTLKGLGSGMDEGVYLFDGTSLSKVADTNTPIPGAVGDFTDFGLPVIRDDGNVAFLGVSEGQPSGVFLFDGTTLRKVADTKTGVPDGKGIFINFFAPAMSDRSLAFGGDGSSGEQGIYFFNGNTLSVVADTNTPIPEGTGQLAGFSSPPAISDNNVAFAARSSSGVDGIYLATHELISPAKVWVGLKNSDDVGLSIDLMAEVFKNDSLLASGELDDSSTGSSGFNRALLRTIPLDPSGTPLDFTSGDALKLRLSVRRTCSGKGHNTGTVRLWYGGSPIDSGKNRDAGTRFDATIGTEDNDYFVRSNFSLNVTPDSSRQFVDVLVNTNVECPDRPFLPFGTWSIVLP